MKNAAKTKTAAAVGIRDDIGTKKEPTGLFFYFSRLKVLRFVFCGLACGLTVGRSKFITFIQLGHGCLIIGLNPKCADTESYAADYIPADEAELQNKYVHFVAHGHAIAFIETLFPCVFGVIGFYLIYKRPCDLLYEAGDDKQQALQPYKKRCTQSEQKVIAEFI